MVGLVLVGVGSPGSPRGLTGETQPTPRPRTTTASCTPLHGSGLRRPGSCLEDVEGRFLGTPLRRLLSSGKDEIS